MPFALYKHGIETYSPMPTGHAGQIINSNFATIADYLDNVALVAVSAVNGHLASLNGTGQPTDSGIMAADVSSHPSTQTERFLRRRLLVALVEQAVV